MEALRLEGNQYFSSNPRKAAECYEKAMKIYEEREKQLLLDKEAARDATMGTLEEYTKCAGNALVALFQAKEYMLCEMLARRALLFNPILAKGYAFQGKVLLQFAIELEPSSSVISSSSFPFHAGTILSSLYPHSGSLGASSFRFLCRAVYQQPGLYPSLQESLSQSIAWMLRQTKEPGLEEEAHDEEEAVEVGVEAGPIGNGVVAYSAVPGGTTLATLEAPFSVGVYEEYGRYGCTSSGDGECRKDERKWRVCTHCGACDKNRVDTFMRQNGAYKNEEDESGDIGEGWEKCESCHSAVVFCTVDCKRAHARQHTLECGPLAKLQCMLHSLEEGRVSVPENFFELAYHSITTVAAIRTFQPGYAVVQQFVSHAQEVAQHVHPTVDLVFELLDGREKKEFIAEVVGIIRCNAIEIVETSSGTGVAQGLYATNVASFFNHSCLPNCSIDAKQKAIVTTRSIQKGESLTISYIPQLYWPTSLRQEELKEQYFFTCCCHRCHPSSVSSCAFSEKGETMHDMPLTDPFEKSLTMELRELPSSISSSSSPTQHFHPVVQAACHRIRSLPAEELKEECIEEMEALLHDVSQYCFPFHYLCHDIRNTLSFIYAVRQRTEKCFLSCLQELLLWECVVPGKFPIKELKIQNCLQCLEDMKKQKSPLSDKGWEEALLQKSLLGPHLFQLAVLYDMMDTV